MAYLSEQEKLKNATIGTKAEVVTSFSFQITHKAITPDQAVQIGLQAEEGYTIWPAEFANTKIDRHNERFTKSVLDVFAAQMNARNFTFNLFHRAEKGIGKTLGGATVVQVGADYVLKGYISINNKSKLPDQEITVNDAIAGNIYTDVSVEISGSTEYISDPSGNRGVWEYYIDPERPTRTQFMGAALVNMGAQIGATVVKSINGIDPESKEETKILNMAYKNMTTVNGKSFAIEVDEKGVVKGADEALKAIGDAYDAEAKATAEKSALATEKQAIEAELTAMKSAMVTDADNLQKLLKVESAKSVDDLGKMKGADLLALVAELRQKHDQAATKSAEQDEEKVKSAQKSISHFASKFDNK